MKLKSCIAIAAAVLMLAPAVLAKDMGTPVSLPNWGTVSIPSDLYVTEGGQESLTTNGDVSKLVENFYTGIPQTYQLIQKDGAVFQYGAALHYSVGLYELNELLGDDAIAVPESRLKSKDKLTLGAVAQRYSTHFSITPPQGFHLVQPVTAVKMGGKTFYEGVVAHDMEINRTTKTELIKVIAWQHGSDVEIAAIMGDSYNKDGIVDNVARMLERAQGMKK